ncbi:MAG: hypothetical protein L6R40_004409 [Gallowayella cf. fulva]|nr:MAG: hypothetical protein L6R40_004409 [Xanthomendoza cf. fulva]
MYPQHVHPAAWTSLSLLVTPALCLPNLLHPRADLACEPGFTLLKDCRVTGEARAVEKPYFERPEHTDPFETLTRAEDTLFDNSDYEITVQITGPEKDGKRDPLTYPQQKLVTAKDFKDKEFKGLFPHITDKRLGYSMSASYIPDGGQDPRFHFKYDAALDRDATFQAKGTGGDEFLEEDRRRGIYATDAVFDCCANLSPS